MALFMESEIWPNIIDGLNKRNITSLIINARLSEKSYKGWCKIKETATALFSSFDLILTQTKTDTEHFKALGGTAKTSGNIKLNAEKLPVDKNDLTAFQQSIEGRPVWLYASTHEGEEELAAQTHAELIDKFPNLLTIIVPRHPVRSGVIIDKIKPMGLNIKARGNRKDQPYPETAIYLANTLGELGLFYRAVPVAMIGRSFSLDGGGGHNPIEAAQLGAAVLTGPNIQYQKNLFNPMFLEGAATLIQSKPALAEQLESLFSNPDTLNEAQESAKNFIAGLDNIIDNVVADIQAFITHETRKAA